jgi:hypothetical protein
MLHNWMNVKPPRLRLKAESYETRDQVASNSKWDSRKDVRCCYFQAVCCLDYMLNCVGNWIKLVPEQSLFLEKKVTADQFYNLNEYTYNTL